MMKSSTPPQAAARIAAHLHDQARYVAELTFAAQADPRNRDKLLAIRDQLFLMRETLDALGVPGALTTNVEWNRSIGTERLT
jgi:hypothetical protein